MPTYVLLMRHDAKGASLMLDAGEDGGVGQVRAVKAYGGNLHAQYGVMGAYDIVLVVDFPDTASCYGFALDATAGGQYTEILTALTKEEVGKATEKYVEAYAQLAPAREEASEGHGEQP